LEEILIEIGYYEPEVIKIEGKGTSPAFLTTLPRKENVDYSE
jgi:hypothetical protein